MINAASVSVLVTTYRRFRNLDRILAAWMDEGADQVWLLDGSGEYESQVEGVRVWNMPIDTGPKSDYAFALMTEGDLIVLADDDLLPLPGMLADLVDGWENVRRRTAGEPIVGIIGRTFLGPDYHANTAFYASNKIDSPVRVGFVGVVCLTPRCNLGFDLRGLPRNADDLWWQMKERPTVPKWVVPTKAYENLPECKDGTAMYRDKTLAPQRQEFYERYYREHYEPEKRIF
ncbi:hypothetical protein HQ520_16330 [bacterium]|nr:hypothetical protein [bacterium]